MVNGLGLNYINQSINNLQNQAVATNAINNGNTSSIFAQINSVGEAANDSFESTVEAENEITSGAKKYTQEEIDAKVEEYNKVAANYQASVDEIKKLIENLKDQLKQAQTEYDKCKKEYDEKKAEYDSLQEKYEQKSEEYKDIEKAIAKATEKAENEAKEQQQAAIYKAMADYNEEEDGDYQEYIKSALEGVVDESSLNSLAEDLSAQAANVLSDLGTIKTNMNLARSNMISAKSKMDAQNVIINGINGQIAAQEAAKTGLEEKMQTLQADLGNIALDSVSDAEKELVTANNIDLTEKFEDGSPKYIIARGKSDNKYHIYEMDGQGACRATSLARKYGANRGFDIVSSGNGYMTNIQDAAEANICNTVFSFDCVSEDLSSGKADACNKCYCTCSPLSFDMDGDGVKTSDNMISYDIDGDGALDNIFDSADAVLVFDNDGDGISGEDGSECFGNNTDIDGDGKKDGFKDGFEALKALANKFGLIDGKEDNVLDEKDINFLEENAGLKIKLNGYNSEAASLKDNGITEINLAATDETIMEDNFDGFGDQLMHQVGATFKVFGEEKEYADIWHRKF